MLRSSFFWRLYAGSVGLILVALLVCVVLSTRWLEASAVRELEAELTDTARVLRELYFPEASAGFDVVRQEELRALGEEISTRITLLDAHGKVLVDTAEDPQAMDDHSQRPEVRAAREGRIPASSVRLSDTLAREMFYVALPVLDGAGELAGFVRTARETSPMGARLEPLRRAAAVAAILAALLALAMGLPFARRVTRALREMTSVAESIASGGYHERLHFPAHGELGRLGRAFDTMAAELELRVESVTTDRNRVHAILAGMVEGVVAVDREELVVHMNGVARRLLRVGAREVEGLKIWEATRLPEVREILVRSMEERRPVQGELSDSASEGPIIELRAGPLTDHRQQVVGAVLVLNDVTELRRLEGMRRDFVANVSHELKTPLTAIRGMIETILDDPEMTAETRQRFLTRVEEQAQRLSVLVTDLLTLSRLESHAPRAERERLDLREVVAGTLARFKPLALSKSIELAAQQPESEQWVSGDEEELRQLVDNLVDNALKYTPEGGRVQLRLRSIAPEGADRAFARLEVADTGIGIAPRDRDRVFERFYRVDKARSRELGGTGLGLAIVKHVALDMGGRVSLESIPGAGTTFRVDLPLQA